jgi:ribosome-associated protein
VGDAAGGFAGASQRSGCITRLRACSTIRTGALLTKTDLKENPETPQPPETPAATPSWLIAVRAAEAKKATDIKVLDLTGITSFADYFVIATGANQRQIQAIADEVGMQLKHAGERPISVEGYEAAEWVLLDYADLLVHVFSTKAREYYDLERLWRNARTVEIPAE